MTATTSHWGDIRVLDCPVCGHHTDDPKLIYNKSFETEYSYDPPYVAVFCARCGYSKTVRKPEPVYVQDKFPWVVLGFMVIGALTLLAIAGIHPL